MVAPALKQETQCDSRSGKPRCAQELRELLLAVLFVQIPEELLENQEAKVENQQLDAEPNELLQEDGHGRVHPSDAVGQVRHTHTHLRNGVIECAHEFPDKLSDDAEAEHEDDEYDNYGPHSGCRFDSGGPVILLLFAVFLFVSSHDVTPFYLLVKVTMMPSW